MKKIVMVLVMVICAVFMGATCSSVVYALDMPYVYNDTDEWLLDRETGEKLFILPSSYYAKLDNIQDTYYLVTFNGVNAKIEKDKVSTIGYHTTPKSTLCDIQIAEKYRIFSEIKLKTSMTGNEEIMIPTNSNMIFLGEYPVDDKIWYYVSFEDKKGYIAPEFTTIPEITIDKFVPEKEEGEGSEVVKTNDKDNETPGESTSLIDKIKNNDIVKILIISGLCLVLVILIILIFIPSKHRKNRYYYEE